MKNINFLSNLNAKGPRNVGGNSQGASLGTSSLLRDGEKHRLYPTLHRVMVERGWLKNLLITYESHTIYRCMAVCSLHRYCAVPECLADVGMRI